MTPVTNPQAEALQQAFQLFNSTSSQLSDAYSFLERRVAELSERLAASNDAHLREFTERQRIAERMQSLLEALPGGMIAVNKNGTIEECNAAARALLGEPVHGLPWTTVSLRAFHKACSDAGELRLNDDRYISISTRSLADGGTVFLFTDVTESRRQQSQLGRYQRLSAIGDMSARLAHQLRTPLATAVLYISRLVDGALHAQTAARLATKALSRLKHLERLIDGMLTYARGEQRADAALVTVADLLCEVKQAMVSEPRARNVVFDCVDVDATVHGQPELLSAAILNLVHNACHAIAEDGRVQVMAKTGGGRARIEISDTGPGIATQLRERVFDPFFTTRSDGTGLGLAIARSIFEGYGGSLTLAPAAPGRGAVFHIELPLTDTSPALYSCANHSETLTDAIARYVP